MTEGKPFSTSSLINCIITIMKFLNKIVLVTGASSGIGAATAVLFAKQGADVALTYKENKKGADEVVAQIESMGRRAIAIQADLTEDANAKRVVDETVKAFGRIDVLVNNAGRYVEGDEWNGSVKIWLQSLRQNLVSVMSMSKYTTEVFQKQQSGVIVNIASSYASNGLPDAPSYTASKAAAVNLTQAYAKLLAPWGRANSVSPAETHSGYWLTAPKEEVEAVIAHKANHRLVEPDEVAEKIVFLCSDEAAEMNGENVLVE